MASLPKDYHLSPEEYLAIERKAPTKSEYVDGVAYLMAGASFTHNVIVGNLVTELNSRLRDVDCTVCPSDMKVRTPDSRTFFYPDVTVVCGEPRFADGEKDVLLNPVLVVEVLSDSTAAFDRGKKFQSYQQIESLREFVLVAQEDMTVESFQWQPNGRWLYTKTHGEQAAIVLGSLECKIPLAMISRRAL